MVIRSCLASDASRICEIYNHYVRETIVTFEEVEIAEPEMAHRIADVTGRLPWIVYEDAGAVAGYAYATMWKTRSAYRYSVESTVYLAADAIGRGIGSSLYRALIADLRARDLHCALGCIALPNAASVALHERLGFRRIGEFKEVGRKLGRWVDVGYWQLLF